MHRPLLRIAATLATSALALLAPALAGATPTVTSIAPTAATYGDVVTVRGTVDSGVAGETVQLEQWIDDGWTSVGSPATTTAGGAWRATFAAREGGPVRATQTSGTLGSSSRTAVTVAPKVLYGRIGRGTIMPFQGASASWRIAPADFPDGRVTIALSIDGRRAGTVRARIKDGRVSAKLPTKGVGRFRAVLELPARGGLRAVDTPAERFTVRGARVGSGSSASWNRSLRAALRYRGFHVPGGTSFSSQLGDAVIAFHKAYGRSRTTTFEASDWTLLTKRAVAVRDRSKPLHIEIDKGRQILMQVKNGKPVFIIHVSSGATGNTPAGHHRILWKGNWVPSLYGSLLYKSMAFQGAFAIHGYPSVPTTPASHGCVRVPMWIAATLYARTPVGTPVFVYESGRGTRPSVGRARRDVPELTGVDPARFADEVA